MSILIFILILSFLIIIHELGHFVMAKRAKMKVEEFGLGYPPRAVEFFKWRGTIFSLNWIPFGGFVRIEGEDETRGKFHHFPMSKRLRVVLAGVIVNFLFGVVAFSIVFSVAGIPTKLNQPRIGQIAPDSPAEQASLPTNVNIVGFKVKNEVIATSQAEEVIEFIAQHQGQEVVLITTNSCQDLICPDSTQEFPVYLRTAIETPEGQGSLGIVFQGMINHYYPWYEMPLRGIWYGLIQALWLGQLIFQALGAVFVDLLTLHQLPQEIAGPVGIVHQATNEDLLTRGGLALLSFSGMLSINLAIVNLLPIPALDGGRAVFILSEKFLGRKRVERLEYYANYIGYFLLLSLIILVTIGDIIRIFN